MRVMRRRGVGGNDVVHGDGSVLVCDGVHGRVTRRCDGDGRVSHASGINGGCAVVGVGLRALRGECVCVLIVCKDFMLQSGDAVSGSGGKHMVAMVVMVAVACSIGGGGGGVANTDHTGVDGDKAWCGW